MIFLTFGLSFGILGLRGIRLHTKPDDKLKNLADRQYTEQIALLPLRGNIYDTRGHELAVSVPTFSLAAHPQLVSDPNRVAKQLSAIFNLKAKGLHAKLASKKKFVWIKRRLMPGEVERIEELNDPGLSLQKEARRYYPNRELASQVLGAAGYDGEALGGLELRYDEYLKEPRIREVAYRDARGAIFDTSDDPLKGHDVSHLHLTIDRNIQYVAETELAAAAHRLKVKKGSVIVMDPRSGAILAMASYPRFNPNTYQNYRLERWRNVGVTDMFEPGSVFKIIPTAIALEKGKVDLEGKIFCENGRMQVGSTVIKDHEKYGDLSLAEIIKFSSNIGATKIANRVGKDDFYNMIKRFGFGETTKLDFPGEVAGRIRDPESWHPVDLAALSFGQGLHVTALQITSAYSVLANGGKRMKPYLVQRITRSDGELIYESEAKSLGQIIQPQTAEILSRLLEGVTEAGGTGINAAIPGYRVAGKTGTAQKYDTKQKAYSKTDYYSSFVGYAPADDARLVVYVGLDGPQGDQIYGGQIAAPIFKNVMSAALYQLKLPPTQRTLPLFDASDDGSKKNKPQGLEKDPESRADLWAPDRQPDQEVAGSAGYRVVPDFAGLNVSQAMSLVEGRGFTIDIEGTGFAYQQEPPPGRSLESDQICRVFFRKVATG